MVSQDYLLSNEYRRQDVDKRLEQLRRLAADKKDIQPEQVDMTNMEAFLIQQGDYIDASYDEMNKEFGSMSAYYREGLGLDVPEINQLRDQLLS